MEIGLYFYLAFMIVIFMFLAIKLFKKRHGEKSAYEEREDNVFYDAVKTIRKDQ